MSSLKSLASKLGQVLVLYGVWGLFAVSFLDSSVIPMPGINDLLLIHLSSRLPLRMPIYVLGCALGSVIGASVIYGLGFGGRRMVKRPDGSGRAERWLARNDFLAVLVVSLLPPPAPFKLFLVTAGAMRVNPWRFILALLVGRGLRFTVEGILAARYGEQAEAYLREHLAAGSLVAVAIILGLTFIFRRFRKPSSAQPPPISR